MTDAGLAALCLAGGLAVALGVMVIGRRTRRTGLLVRPWLLAIWILLTIGLTASASGGVVTLGPVDWTLAASWLVISILVHLIDRKRKRSRHASRRWGARLAHLGIVVAVGGIILSSAFTMTSERAMSPGDKLKFGAWTVQFHDVWPAVGDDWAGVSAELRASSGNGAIVLEPQQRTAFDRTTHEEPALVSNISGILTTRLGQRDAHGRSTIELIWTPLLALIALGGAIAALGGIVAMIGPAIARWHRMRRARLANVWWG